jgi:arabinoxylan arabinofuranohydrolase
MEDQTFEIDATKFKGTKSSFFLIVKSATDFYVDAWQFTEAGTTGIQGTETSKPVKQQSYDLSGRSLSDPSQHRGIVIEQYTDEKGVKHSRKRF